MMGIEIRNVLQVDVEEWYSDIDFAHWIGYEDRVVSSTVRLLDILRETDTKATFFILGYVAEHHPQLVQLISDEGHEIGTHGYRHTHLRYQSPSQFSEDLHRSIEVLEQITKTPVLGYRACQFSVTESTGWAIQTIKQAGLRYDSSVFPVKSPYYGIPRANRFAYRISPKLMYADNPEEEFWEVPLSVLRLPVLNMNIPIAGGFYLRFFPYALIKFAINRINNKDRQPAVCYIHPWEMDCTQPRIAQLPWYHYYRLRSTEGKFRKLLRDFRWAPTKEVFGFD